MSAKLLAYRLEFILLAGICLVGGSVHLANSALEERIEIQEADGSVGLLPDGRVLRVLSMGFDRLAADLFWLRTVNYIGDERAENRGYPQAAALGELVTDIDPKFKTAYSVMNTVLTMMARPKQVDAAIRLLEKGLGRLDWWKLHFLQGFNYYFEKADYARGAVHIQEAAIREGSPPYLKRLAGKLHALAGSPEAGLSFVYTMLQEAQTEHEKEALAERYRELWIERDLRSIDSAIQAHRDARGGLPGDVVELVRGGFLGEEPRDPSGGPYEIQNGVAATTQAYERLKIYRNVKEGASH